MLVTRLTDKIGRDKINTYPYKVLFWIFLVPSFPKGFPLVFWPPTAYI